MKNYTQILLSLLGITLFQTALAQTSQTANTSNQIYISSGVQWSDWGTNYGNGTNGTISNNGIFIFKGRKFTNSGIYSSTAGSKDSFNSSYIDTIAGSFRARFYDVIFNNGSHNFSITNDSGIMVNHNINLNSLIVTTNRNDSSTGAINIANGATYTGTMSSSKHVDGYVTKFGNSSFIFPVGNNGKYHPLTISAPSNTSSALGVAYFYSNPATADPTGGAHSLSSLTSPLMSVSNNQFWDVVTVQSPMVVDVTVNFESLVGGYVYGYAVKMVGWNKSTGKWEIMGNGAPTAMTSGGTITNTGIDLSKYSAITIGSSLEVLPVQLISFTGQKFNDHESQLDWTTASETNNQEFIVERSSDGLVFTEIGRKAGAGNSGSINNYELIDLTPLSGINYYRLKQVNFDGTFDYSNVISVSFDGINANAEEDDKVDLLNSLSAPALRITTPASWSNNSYTIEVFNISGQMVKSLGDFDMGGGSEEIKNLDLGSLPSGVYVAVLSNNTQKRKKTFKVLK